MNLPETSITATALDGVRVLAALNGLELFGHERGNIEVLKGLRRCGANVMVAVNALEGGGQVNEELEAAAIPTGPVPFGGLWSPSIILGKPAYALTNLRALGSCSREFRALIDGFRPTHIHIGSPLVYSYLATAIKKSGVRMIYRLGDAPPVASRFQMAIWRRATGRADRVVANSHFVRDAAIAGGVHAEKLATIYGCAPERSRVSLRHSVPQRRFILYVGSVSEHKGLVPLVDAFASIADEIPDIQLDIVGESRWDSSFRTTLISRVESLGIASKVVFRGHVDDPSSDFRDAVVHAVPSLCEESAANVVLEAKMAGTPSVVFPSGSLAEFVRHRVDGIVCPEKTARSLGDALRFVLLNDDERARMQYAAREDYERRFGRARFDAEWAQVYGAPTVADS